MTIHFVGAGPGAADLITVRAARMLASADVVLYPGTYIDQDVLSHCRGDTTLVDTQQLDREQITTVLVTAHQVGHTVVRLTSGDPSVYSALSEQTRRLDAEDVPWEVTPGIAAYAAAAARVGRELTVPELAQSVVLTRTQARSTQMPAGEELAAFAATGATLVLHLAIRHTRELATLLADHYGTDCPAVVAYRVSQPEEQVLRGTLADVADRVEQAGLTQAAVILVGPALGEPDERAGESFLYDPSRERSGSGDGPSADGRSVDGDDSSGDGSSGT